MHDTRPERIAAWFRAHNPGTFTRKYDPKDVTPGMADVERAAESPSFWVLDRHPDRGPAPGDVEGDAHYYPAAEHWPLIEAAGIGDPDFVLAYIEDGEVVFEIL